MLHIDFDPTAIVDPQGRVCLDTLRSTRREAVRAFAVTACAPWWWLWLRGFRARAVNRSRCTLRRMR